MNSILRTLVGIPFALACLFFWGSLVLDFIAYPAGILTVLLFPISILWAGLQALILEAYVFMGAVCISIALALWNYDHA